MGKNLFLTLSLCIAVAGCAKQDAPTTPVDNNQGGLTKVETPVSPTVRIIADVKADATRLRASLTDAKEITNAKWLEIGRLSAKVVAVVRDLDVTDTPEARQAVKDFNKKTESYNSAMMTMNAAEDGKIAKSIYKDAAEAVSDLEKVVAWLADYEGLARKGYLYDEMAPEGRDLAKDPTSFKLSTGLELTHLRAAITARNAETMLFGETSICMAVGSLQSSGLRNLQLIAQLDLSRDGRNSLRTLRYQLEQIEEHCLEGAFDSQALRADLKVVDETAQKLSGILFR